MEHALLLAKKQGGGPVACFARNRLCAMTQAHLRVSADSLLDVLLDRRIRLGISTPQSDPAGDYAIALFHKAEWFRPGSCAALDAKAMKLTGGPSSETAPAGRNQYAWIMENDKADVFLTYYTNAMLARAELPQLNIVPLPIELSVGTECGILVLSGAPNAASRFVRFVLSDAGQSILRSFGFETRAVSASR